MNVIGIGGGTERQRLQIDTATPVCFARYHHSAGLPGFGPASAWAGWGPLGQGRTSKMMLNGVSFSQRLIQSIANRSSLKTPCQTCPTNPYCA